MRIALTNGIVGDGCALFRAVVDADLEGIVAKRLADAYQPQRVRWHKILNRGYSHLRDRIACRHCHRLDYASRHLRRQTPGVGRVERLRRKLGDLRVTPICTPASAQPWP